MKNTCDPHIAFAAKAIELDNSNFGNTYVVSGISTDTEYKNTPLTSSSYLWLIILIGIIIYFLFSEKTSCNSINKQKRK